MYTYIIYDINRCCYKLENILDFPFISFKNSKNMIFFGKEREKNRGGFSYVNVAGEGLSWGGFVAGVSLSRGWFVAGRVCRGVGLSRVGLSRVGFVRVGFVGVPSKHVCIFRASSSTFFLQGECSFLLCTLNLYPPPRA